MRPWLIAGLAFVLALFGATVERAHAATPVTVAAVRASPADYQGQTVTLHGFIDQCTDFQCHLCDGQVFDEKSCITLRSWALAAPSAPPPVLFADHSEIERVEALLNQLYRFAAVTVQAKVAWYGPRAQAEAQAKVEAMEARGFAVDRWPCTSSRVCINDGDVWLEMVSVTVERRYDALHGVLTPDRGEILAPGYDLPIYAASPADYREMLKAVPNADHLMSAEADRIYDPKGYVSGADKATGGWLCVQGGGGLTSDWPTKVGHLLNAPANRYVCHVLVRDPSGNWRMIGDPR